MFIMPNINTDLYALVDEIMTELKENDLPPIPENFSFYFDKLLETRNDEFRQRINSITPRLNVTSHNGFEYERSLNKGAKAVKLILTQGSNIYKNTALLKKIIQIKKEIVVTNKNHETLLEVTSSVENTLDKFLVSLEKQSASIKELYGTAANSIKNAKKSSLYNANLGVYNKNYFITIIEQERGSCANIPCESSLLSISLSFETMQIEGNKSQANIIRDLGKILTDALRRSDSISYYGNGIFSILLRHTNEEDAEIAAIRFNRLIAESICITDMNNEHILIGVVQIDSCLNAEELLEQSVEAMKSAGIKNPAE